MHSTYMRLIGSIKSNKIEILVVLLIFFSAAFLRFYNLEWEAISWNEGTLLGGSKEYVKGNFLYNFNDFAAPPLLKYLGAVELYFFGFSEFFLRSIGVIFGLGTVILTYLIARKYYSRKTAIFAMVVVAFSMIHINFSRTFLTEPVLAFFFTASFYAYVNLLKGDKNRRGILILGVCLAFALLSKWIGLNLIIVIIIHALYTKLIM